MTDIGRPHTIINDEVVYIDDLKAAAIKKKECREKIFSFYSQTDQDNIKGNHMIDPNLVEVTKMMLFINTMIAEYQTNGMNADYSAIEPVDA